MFPSILRYALTLITHHNPLANIDWNLLDSLLVELSPRYWKSKISGILISVRKVRESQNVKLSERSSLSLTHFNQRSGLVLHLRRYSFLKNLIIIRQNSEYWISFTLSCTFYIISDAAVWQLRRHRSFLEAYRVIDITSADHNFNRRTSDLTIIPDKTVKKDLDEPP